MRTRKDISVLYLQDGTPICTYCGKKLNVKHEVDWDEYDKDEYDLYECNCEDWNNALELEKELKNLNKEIKKQFNKYQGKFKALLGNGYYKVDTQMYYGLISYFYTKQKMERIYN